MPLPTYRHPVAGEVWVDIDARDSLAGLAPCYLTNPDEWVPKLCAKTGAMEAWGLDREFESSEDDRESSAYKRIRTCDLLYAKKPNPQEQFVKHLCNKKHKAIVGARNVVRSKCDYIIKIALSDIKDNSRDMIWRRVKVSGGLKLHVLQDKVIQPTIGWCRNYHAYLFTDRRDGSYPIFRDKGVVVVNWLTRRKGSLFGPKNSHFYDLLHMVHMGHTFMAADQYTLSDVLTQEGDQMGYVYDLCSKWRHEITLEQMLLESESDGRAKVLDGDGACPADDFSGNNAWKESLVDIIAGTPEIMDLIKGSLNYRYQRLPSATDYGLDPRCFRVEDARQRLAQALASTCSIPACPKRVIPVDADPRDVKEALKGAVRLMGIPISEPTSTNLEGLAYQAFGAGPEATPGESSSEGDRGTTDLWIEGIRLGGDLISEAVCENCGKPNGLSRCTRCKTVWYCSKSCQKDRWSVHKTVCRPASIPKKN